MQNKIKKEFFILIVEDDQQTIEFLKQALDQENFNVIEATNDVDALTAVATFNIHLAIIDYYLEYKTADALIDKLIDKKTPVGVISGSSDIKRELLTEKNVSFFLEKPFGSWELKSFVNNYINLFSARKELESAQTVIEALSKSVEVRDPYTQGHSEAVARLALDIYHELDFNFIDEENALFVGCILHDIGKIGIPDNILKSENKLSEEDFKLIKTHPIKGWEICKDLKGTTDSLDVILYHHEKLDGSGYPYGLKGNKIPKIVQITTVADIYDALTSERSYRRGLDDTTAFSILDSDAAHGKINEEYVEILKKIKKFKGE